MKPNNSHKKFMLLINNKRRIRKVTSQKVFSLVPPTESDNSDAVFPTFLAISPAAESLEVTTK